MPRYKVAAYGGVDGLLFEDLIVTYSSGYKFPLRVKQGTYVPIEIFDPLDIQKSLIVGSLGNYIRAGAVKVEYNDIEQNKRKRKPRQQTQVVQPQNPSVEKAAPEAAPQQKSEETKSVQEAPTDLKTVDIFEQFKGMNYFQKLKFIQSCTDKSLLTELQVKYDKEAPIKAALEDRLQTM